MYGSCVAYNSFNYLIANLDMGKKEGSKKNMYEDFNALKRRQITNACVAPDREYFTILETRNPHIRVSDLLRFADPCILKLDNCKTFGQVRGSVGMRERDDSSNGSSNGSIRSIEDTFFLFLESPPENKKHQVKSLPRLIKENYQSNVFV